MDKRKCMVKRWHIGGGITVIFSKTIKDVPAQENEAQNINTDKKKENAQSIRSC